MNLKISALTAVLATLIASSATAEPKTYAIDRAHMEVTYSISHFGLSTSRGRFADVTSALTLDEANPAASKVDATIKVDSLDSGWPARTKHILSADFLDAEKYPTITFVTTGVTPTGARTSKVAGTLTIHGVSRPVIMDVRLVSLGPHPLNGRFVAGVHAETKIKRSDYGVTEDLPGLGDDVTIVIDAEYGVPRT